MRINFLTCRTITSLLLAATLLAAAEASASKVTICHAPPGNPDNAHTITVNQKSLPAHLAHGDIVGACPPANVGYRIDSAGGLFEYPGGLVLEVPPGAVLEPVTVELSLTDCGPLEPILNDRVFSTQPEKRCLAAFAGTPSGFEFNSPVLVRLPLARLASGTIPILADVDQILGTYQLLPTVIDYDGVSGIVQMELIGFSDKALGSYELSPGDEFGPEWAAAGEEIEARCASCAGQFDNGGANLPFCENLDLYQSSCCLIPPTSRGPCASTCFCCKEQEARVIVSDVDFASGDCQLLGSSITVTYPRCPGSPTYEDSMGEASDECGEDTVWQITVEPPNADIRACTTETFTATIGGSSPDGSVVFEPASLPAFWSSTDTSVASFTGGDGTLEGKKKGTTEVEARISANNPIDAVGRAPVTVRSNIDSFTVDPASASIKVDEMVAFEVEAVAAAGASPPPESNDTNWSSSKPNVAEVTPAGSLASVRGINSGFATITAELDYLCETVTATAGVTVGCKEVEFTLSDSSIYLPIDGSHSLSARAIDKSDGSVLDTTGVTWESGAETVVGLGNRIGTETTVKALQPTVLGPVPVSATYDDGCQEIPAVALVTVSCLNLELSVEEGAVAIGASLPITVAILDDRGEPVEDIDESKIEWTSSDDDVAIIRPEGGSARVNVIGVSPGTVTITAEYDAGPCGIVRSDPSATIKVGNTIAGLWHLTPVTQYEGCKYVDAEEWIDEDPFDGFDVNVEQPVSEDDSVITASYVPDVGLRLSGNWDSNTGEFDLATNTSDPSECGYQFFWDNGADICGEAVECEFEACQNTTSIVGLTTESVDGGIDSMDAESNWYLAVSFSFASGSPDLPRGTNTLECEGNATVSGSRPEPSP